MAGAKTPCVPDSIDVCPNRNFCVRRSHLQVGQAVRAGARICVGPTSRWDTLSELELGPTLLQPVALAIDVLVGFQRCLERILFDVAAYAFEFSRIANDMVVTFLLPEGATTF